MKRITISIVIVLSSCRYMDKGMVVDSTERNGNLTNYHAISISRPDEKELVWTDSNGKFIVGDTVWMMKKH